MPELSKGRVGVYRELGGVYVARSERFFAPAFRATWPFGCITVREDGLCLRALWLLRYEVRREELVEIRATRGWFAGGFQLVHVSPSLPRRLVFAPLAPGRLRRRLEEFGYGVTS